MKQPLNEQQTKAVTEFGADLLVTAGAGTGKTSVLTNKFLRLLEERRAGVGEIVAITFTKKAAAEMRSRIQAGIQEHLQQAGNPAESEFWQQQLLKMESARISTFHSFCLGLLREHPLEVEIPPVTGILSEGEETIYLNRVIEGVLLEVFHQSQFDQPALTRMMLEFGWEAFIRSLATIYQKVRESGQSVTKLIQGSSEFLTGTIRRIPYQNCHLAAEIEDLLAFSATVDLTENAAAIIGSLQEKWAGQKRLLETGAAEIAFTTMLELKKGLPKTVPNVLKDRVTEIHGIIDGLAKKLADREALIRLAIIGALLDRVHQSYAILKRELGLLDFTDQLVLARDLLKSYPEIAAQVRQEIQYLLVDEFQDTNSLQLEIVDLLVGSEYIGGRFMAVGDIKQSIYRFRGAEADLITGLARRLAESQGKIIPLSRNYRSNRQIITFVNNFFTQLFQEETFSYEPLEAALEDQQSNVEFILTGSPDRQEEAWMVAERIQQLVTESEVFHYGDIVMLFRASTSMHLYQQALQKLGIPYYTASGGGFYNRPEVVDQLNLLRLTEQRFNGVALLGLLTSPYVNLTNESLLWMGEGRELLEQFYERESFLELIPAPERIRLQKFRGLVGYLQRNRENLNIPALIRVALERSNYREILWTLPNAGQRLANLDKLLEKADEFAGKGFYDLRQFLEFIEKLEEVEVLEGEAQTQAETGEAVRLMTIHRAKGLEFPVVILPDLDRQFPINSQGKLAFHKTAGLGICIGFGEGVNGPSSLWEKIKELDKREEFSELKRLLYVALTRAKQQLIMVGSGCNRSKGKTIETANNWMKWFEIILPLAKAVPHFDYQGVPVKITRELPVVLPPVPAVTFLEENSSLLAESVESDLVDLREVAVTSAIEKAAARTYKVTEFLVFKECARRYFWEYRCGLKEDVFAARPPAQARAGHGLGAEIGSFVHQAFQLKDSNWPEKLWQATFKDLPVHSSQSLKTELMRMWQNFRESQFTEKYGTPWDEIPFMVKLDEGLRLEGRFDRLLQNNNGELILVDYKTHRIGEQEASQKANSYFWQLQLYALAVKVLWGRLPDQAALYFLHPNSVVPVPLDEDSLARTKKEIDTITHFLAEHHNIEDYPQGDNCKICSYACFCKP